jgi:hypothetical protein
MPPGIGYPKRRNRGNDIISGGAGDDTLAGGAVDDAFGGGTPDAFSQFLANLTRSTVAPGIDAPGAAGAVGQTEPGEENPLFGIAARPQSNTPTGGNPFGVSTYRPNMPELGLNASLRGIDGIDYTGDGPTAVTASQANPASLVPTGGTPVATPPPVSPPATRTASTPATNRATPPRTDDPEGIDNLASGGFEGELPEGALTAAHIQSQAQNLNEEEFDSWITKIIKGASRGAGRTIGEGLGTTNYITGLGDSLFYDQENRAARDAERERLFRGAHEWMGGEGGPVSKVDLPAILSEINNYLGTGKRTEPDESRRRGNQPARTP